MIALNIKGLTMPSCSMLRCCYSNHRAHLYICVCNLIVILVYFYLETRYSQRTWFISETSIQEVFRILVCSRALQETIHSDIHHNFSWQSCEYSVYDFIMLITKILISWSFLQEAWKMIFGLGDFDLIIIIVMNLSTWIIMFIVSRTTEMGLWLL